MVLLTATVLGLSAGLLRSAAAHAIIAALLAVVFIAAAVTSSGPVALLSLGLAVAGYNLGLIALVLGMLVTSPAARPAPAKSK